MAVRNPVEGGESHRPGGQRAAGGRRRRRQPLKQRESGHRHPDPQRVHLSGCPGERAQLYGDVRLLSQLSGVCGTGIRPALSSLHRGGYQGKFSTVFPAFFQGKFHNFSRIFSFFHNLHIFSLLFDFSTLFSQHQRGIMESKFHHFFPIFCYFS